MGFFRLYKDIWRRFIVDVGWFLVDMWRLLIYVGDVLMLLSVIIVEIIKFRIFWEFEIDIWILLLFGRIGIGIVDT